MSESLHHSKVCFSPFATKVKKIDSEFGVMLQLKLVTSANLSDDKVDDGSEGLDMAMHCCVKRAITTLGWFRLKEIGLCAFSFCIIKSALTELDQLNFAFIGVVKTGTKQFPMDHLRAVETLEGNGTCSALCSENENGLPNVLAFV